MEKTRLYQLRGYRHTSIKNGTFSQMMSYVVVTKTGKIIVIDGGYKEDAPHLLEFLRQIGGNKPTVDLWLMSHMHNDHVMAFAQLMKSNFDELCVKKVCFNFPAREYFTHAEEGGSLETYDAFFENYDRFSKLYEPAKTGDKYIIDDVTIEVVFTSDGETDDINDTSSVFRFEVENQAVLFLGDLGAEGGRKMLKSVSPEKIQADIVQMAHHGQNGVEFDVYKAISPKCCLWSTPDWLWDNNAGGGFDTHIWKTVEVRGWVEQLGVCRNIVSKDGTQMLELPCDDWNA